MNIHKYKCVYIYIYVTYSLSVHLLLDTRQLVCLHTLAIVNNSVIKIRVHISSRISIF